MYKGTAGGLDSFFSTCLLSASTSPGAKLLVHAKNQELVALPLSTESVTPPGKVTMLVRQDLPLVKPCWLSHITIASRRICSMIFPGTEVKLTGQ